MSKLQRIIIIVAAFGVVSIILTQAQSFSVATHTEKPRGAAIAPIPHQTVNVHHPNLSRPTLNSEQKVTSNANFVTNIYQSGSGHFYFENTQSIEQQKSYKPATLTRTKADINVTGPIARTRFTQVFANTSESVQSGVYVFPLPHDAAVDQLLMQVGERKIEGRIERKNTAKKLFEQAQVDGKKASLISQLRPNMFTNHVANIPPHSEITVTIEYQQFIIQDNYHYALRLPLSITPRYQAKISAKDEQVDALLSLPNSQAQGMPNNAMVPEPQHLNIPLEINVRLNTGLPIGGISSEHHPIQTTNPYNTEYRVTLDTKKPLNKDFVLNWQLKPNYSFQASHFRYQTHQYEYGLITLLPPKQDAIKAKRNLVFVLDVSGSMVGDAITQAKQSLAYAIDDLLEDDYFNIISFNSDTDTLWPQSQQASDKRKTEALTYIYNLDASGGTEIKPALETAFTIPHIQDEQSSFLNQILFITDGSVSNENEIIQAIYQKLGSYRLFTVGIGNAPNAFFMSEAAAAGRGTFTFIGDIAHVKSKMKRLIEKLKHPALNNIQLNIKDPQRAFSFEIYPSILPDLYAGEPLVVTYRREIENKPTNQIFPFSINGQYLSKTVGGALANRTWSSQLPSVSVTHERGIHKYWAKQKINSLHKQLNMQVSSLQDTDTMKENIKEGITNVALEHHLVSKYTSLIAIDHQNEQAANQSEKHVHPLTQYAQASLPQTATPSMIYLITGITILVFSFSLLVFSKPATTRSRCHRLN